MSNKRIGSSKALKNLKHRGSWYGVNPVTKVMLDKTKYSRKVKFRHCRLG